MNSENILDESKNYIVTHTYETVYLINKFNYSKIIIGDFYGEPNGAIIDADECFVVVYGCGVILYFLQPPFQEYSYETNTSQWLEWGRIKPIMWVDKVVPLDNNRMKIILENGQTNIITI